MKQCPFCGSDNLVKVRDSIDDSKGLMGDVYCLYCGGKALVRNWDNRDFSAACDELLNTMIDSHASNYNQHSVSGNDGNEYVITVQLKEGETPCQQLAAAKAREAELVEDCELNVSRASYYQNEAYKYSQEVQKLSPLVLLVSNQKQRIRQLEEALLLADKWLDIDAQYYGSPVCNKIKNALPKYKDTK